MTTSRRQDVQIRRSRLLGLLGGAAAAAAAITWAVLAFGVYTGGGQTQTDVSAQPVLVSSPIPMTGYLDEITSRPTVVPQTSSSDEYVQSIGGIARLQQDAAAREAVLDSLSPSSRQYVEQFLS